MKFVDEAMINVNAGNGGHGCLSFRREKFVPHGGPDGGNGGKGGDVVLVAVESRNTLADFRYTREFSAANGRPGAGRNRSGAGGDDRVIAVPAGTLIFDGDTGERLTDLAVTGQSFVVAAGGRGGAGNARFKSSTNQAPRRTTPGVQGDRRRLRLELQVLADVGLLGLPNAGKSTLLTAVSAAKPRVADYPFTTLYPELGVVDLGSGNSFVVADIPGLIEGAAEGVGLGVQFLKHLRRTRLLLHLVDIGSADTSDPPAAIRTVERELEAFDSQLAGRPRWLVLTKLDLVETDRATRFCEQLQEELGWTAPIFLVSGVSGAGCGQLTASVWNWLNENTER
jgi:GTP-binding protein